MMSISHVSRRKAGERKPMADISKISAWDNPFLGSIDNSFQRKPRKMGLTEIEGLFEQFEDVFEGLSPWIDGVRFPASCFPFMDDDVIRKYVTKAHSHGLYVSTGDWAEHILASRGTSAVDKFVKDCKMHGFDVVEVKTNVPNVSEQAVIRLIRALKQAGLTVKPQIGVDDVGSSLECHLAAGGDGSSMWVVQQAERCLKAGADLILVDSEGLTNGVDSWRTDLVASIVGRIGLERIMFTAADAKAAEWYVRSYGSQVNLAVDHNHVVPIASLRNKKGAYALTSPLF